MTRVDRRPWAPIPPHTGGRLDTLTPLRERVA
jgi:hypothetical protein